MSARRQCSGVHWYSSELKQTYVKTVCNKLKYHQLAAVYQLQLEVRTQVSDELVQEFAAALKQLVHCALVRLPKDFIQREAACAFVDGVKDWNVKQHHLVGGERSCSEALKLEAVKVPVRPLAKLWEVRAGAPTRIQSPVTECCRTG
jgi:hypothetical protein